MFWQKQIIKSEDFVDKNYILKMLNSKYYKGLKSNMQGNQVTNLGITRNNPIYTSQLLKTLWIMYVSDKLSL